MLETIVARKREEVAGARAAVPLEEMQFLAEEADPPRDFAGALRAGFAVIAEIKPASPITGRLREGVDPTEAADLARRYEAGGARALSVLTDKRFFGGGRDLLAAARAAVTLPVLRKDFVLEPYQIYETRAMGADAVLLITALLAPPLLRELTALCHALAMDALAEVHTEAEVATAASAGARIIGINNRDLRTFAVDLGVTARLRTTIPAGLLVVSESGIATSGDVARLRPHVDAILVGTVLMTSDDPAAAVRALAHAGRLS
jgi:indole-3-glycerol phosphate synthase